MSYYICHEGLRSRIYRESVELKSIQNGQRTWTGYFSKGDMQWPIKTWKDIQVLPIIREIQIKTTVIYHLTPIRWLVSKNCVGKDMETLGLLCTAIGNIKWYSHLWGGKPIVWFFLKKLNITSSPDPEITLLGIHSKKLKISPRDICTSM